MAIETSIYTLALNVNGSNNPTKRHRLTEWIKKKQDLYTHTHTHTYTYAVDKRPIFILGTCID